MLGKLIDKLPHGAEYKQKAIGFVNDNPRTFAVSAAAAGAMLLLATLFGVGLPASAVAILFTAVVMVGCGKWMMNKYLRGAHGDKKWFKTIDRVMNIAFPILVVGGAIAAASLYGGMLALPAAASATGWTLLRVPMAVGLPLLVMVIGMRIGNREFDKAVAKAHVEGNYKKERYLNAARNSLLTVQAILMPAVYIGILSWMLAGGPAASIYFIAGLIMTPFLCPIVAKSTIPKLQRVSDNIQPRKKKRRQLST